MSLNGNYRITVSFLNEKDNVDRTVPSERLSDVLAKEIDSGVLYHDSITLSANEVKTLNFGNGSLFDVFGESISLTGVTGLFVNTDEDNTSDITLSGGLSAFLNTQPALGPSESLGFLTDIDITSAPMLYFINGATSGSIIDIVITGNE
jgi:hypothetical protein